MSDFTETCDFFHTVLEAVVPGVVQHRYAPWDPERFQNDGQRHLAVWPTVEAEVADAYTTRSKLLRQNYTVAYWEPGDDEDERQVVDEQAAADLYDLQNAIREALFDLANQPSNTLTNYTGSAFRESTSPIRGFLMNVSVDRPKDLT